MTLTELSDILPFITNFAVALVVLVLVVAIPFMLYDRRKLALAQQREAQRKALQKQRHEAREEEKAELALEEQRLKVENLRISIDRKKGN